MGSIERDSPIPLYYQLKQLLGDRIANGELQSGDMFPTEEQLQTEYEVSRTTVRQALKELELEGLVSRQRGRGTFVTQPKIDHSPEPNFSLTDALVRQGIKPDWRVLSAGWVAASIDVADQLELDPGTPVFQLQRLRLTDDEPIGYHIAHAAPAAATSIDKEKIAEGGSLRYLRGSDALAHSYVNRTIEAIGAPAEVAQLLDVEEGSPILLISRQVLNPDGVVLEILQAMYRGDRLQYHVRQGPEVKRA
jgi:DNA-binding GntR family transcriptional regulator